MKIEFDSRKYVISHAKEPKGTGLWMFECEGRELEAWGTLTAAKKQVRAQVKALAPKDFEGTVYVYVLP